MNPEITTKFTGFLILLGESVMDNLILGPTDFDMEKLLLLEARVYELLSELLLFVLSLNPKCIRHSYGIALHRKH